MPEKPAPPHPAHHERIEDPIFRHAIDLIDAGDAEALRAYLRRHAELVRQRVVFAGDNYFRNPSLIEFIAENPIRRGSLPKNIVQVAEVLVNAGAERFALQQTLGLVATGRIARECGLQIPLIDFLCGRGASPDGALQAAIGHGEFAAAEALIARGAPLTLPVAAALGRVEHFLRLLPDAAVDDRRRALAAASQFGHADFVRVLLDAGEDPNRYNPAGFHSHSTPLHQAAFAGHEKIVRLLVDRGARLDARDLHWEGTPADWAHHGGMTDLEAWLRARENEAGKST